jgi:hypothetical protein
MENAISAFIASTTEKELNAAYMAMLEWSDAPEGAEVDDVDAMLAARGLPSLYDKLANVAA